MTAPDARQPDEPWRIGTSWGIHVYQGEKGSPGERPVATFHDPADAQRAVDAVNGSADGRPSDELREALFQAVVDRGPDEFTEDFVARRLLPVVTAWAEKQARARAAEELRKAADAVRHQLPGFIGRVDTADAIDDRADALTAGDPA